MTTQEMTNADIVNKLKGLSESRRKTFVADSGISPEAVSQAIWSAYADGQWGEDPSYYCSDWYPENMLLRFPQAASYDLLMQFLNACLDTRWANEFFDSFYWYRFKGLVSLMVEIATRFPDQLLKDAAQLQGDSATLAGWALYSKGLVSTIPDASVELIASAWIFGHAQDVLNFDTLSEAQLARAVHRMARRLEGLESREHLEICYKYGTPLENALLSIHYRPWSGGVGWDEIIKMVGVAGDEAHQALLHLAVDPPYPIYKATYGRLVSALVELAGARGPLPEALGATFEGMLSAMFCQSPYAPEFFETVQTMLRELPAHVTVPVMRAHFWDAYCSEGMFPLLGLIKDDAFLLEVLDRVDAGNISESKLIGQGIAAVGARALAVLAERLKDKKLPVHAAAAYARALSELDGPESARMLVDLLGHSSKEVHGIANAALTQRGDTVRAALEAGTKARKKAIRETCEELLGRLETADNSDSPLGALARRAAKLSDAERKSLRQTVDHRNGRGPLFPPALVEKYGTPTLLYALRDWFVGPDSPNQSDYRSVFWDFHDAVTACEDPAGAYWVFFDCLNDFAATNPDAYFINSRLEITGEEAAPAAAYVLQTKPLYYLPQLIALAAKDPTCPPEAFAAQLSHKTKAVREAAAAALATRGEDAVPAVTPMLGATKKADRLEAARVLGELASPAAVSALRDALKVEKYADVSAAIEAAIFASDPDAASADNLPDNAADWDAYLARTKQDPDAAHARYFDRSPVLRYKSGEAMSQSALGGLITRVKQLGPDHDDPVLYVLRTYLNDEDCWALSNGYFGATQVDEWSRAEGMSLSSSKWCVYQQAIFAPEARLRRVAPELDDLAMNRRQHLAYWYLDTLDRCGSKRGREWILYLRGHAKSSGLRDHAAGLIEAIAQREGVTVAKLRGTGNPFFADMVAEEDLPTFGFDARGGRTLDYGPREVLMRLGAQGELQYVMGADIKDKLPAARKSDDADKAQAAIEAARETKKQLKSALKGVAERFETALVSGRTWPGANFVAHIVEHPVASTLATGVVFGDDAGQIFRISEERELIDVDGAPVALGDGASVHVVHPLELSEAARAAWSEHLRDAEVMPPILQLARPTFAGVEDVTVPTSFFAGATWVGRVRKLGIDYDEVTDSGVVERNVIRLDHRGAAISIEHDGYFLGSTETAEKGGLQVEAISLLGADRSEPADPIGVSEACYVLHRLLHGG